MITYRELLEKLKTLSSEQLDSDATVKIDDEYHAINSYREEEETDVLDKGHPFLEVSDVEGPREFLNKYCCSDCGNEWRDTWTATCDDRCPECDTSCSPYESEDVPPSQTEDYKPKLNEKVYWNDPDEGVCSGAYTIRELRVDFAFLVNEHGSELEAPYHELSPYLPAVIMKGNMSDGYKMIGPFDSFDLAAEYDEEYPDPLVTSWIATLNSP